MPGASISGIVGHSGIANRINTLSPLALAGSLAAPLVMATAADNVFDVMKKRFELLNAPKWEAAGKARMYGELGDTVRYVRGQEALLDGMYKMPLNILEHNIKDLPSFITGEFSKAKTKRKAYDNFEQIVNDPSVVAYGVDNARDIFRDVARVSPTLVSKSPRVALAAIQNAYMTNSGALRPDYISDITKADFNIRQPGRR